MKKYRYILFVSVWAFLQALISTAQTNRGTDFWIGFMEHVDINQNVKVLMITSDKNTSGTISIPLQSWTTTFSVNANDVKLVVLPSTAQTIGSEAIDDAGIHITSDDTIVVYAHQYSSKRSEAAIILPTDALGSTYYAMTYIGTDNKGTPSPAEFLAVATSDSTELTITVSDDTKGGRSAGSTFIVSLNQGETYQVQSLLGTGGDLTGSYVSGDKPFAFFAGNRWTAVGGCKAMDNLYEQMYPVNTWGKEYIISRTQGRPNLYDIVRIIASKDSTNIYINGTFTTTLNAGAFYEYNEYNDASYISADNPICVAQFITGSGCYAGNSLGDPSMILANPIGQTIEEITFYSSPYEDIDSSCVNIIATTADTASVLFDGLPISAWGYSFTPVPGKTAYSYVYLNVDTGVHHIDGGSCGITGIVYGFGDIESYGYSVGASYKNLSLDFSVSSCTKDSLRFTATTGSSISQYHWDFGDGNQSTASNPIHIYADTGYYTVSLLVYVSTICTRDSIVHSKVVHVNWIDSTGTTITDESCLGSGDGSIHIQPYGGTAPYSYLWSDSLHQTSSLASSLSQGTYQVTITDSVGCTFVQSITIKSPPALINTMNSNTLFCGIGAATANPSGGLPSTLSGYTYLWNDPLMQTTQTASDLSTGTYTVVIKDSTGCSLSDSIAITVYDLPLVDAGSDQSICPGNTFILGGSPSAPAGSQLSWSTLNEVLLSTNSNPILLADSNTTYYLSVIDSNGCSGTDSVSISIFDPVTITISNDTTICRGDSIMLQATGGTTYQWQYQNTLSDTSIANPIAYPLNFTTYSVSITDSNNCITQASVSITPYSPTITAGTGSWVCEGTPTNLSVTGGVNYSWFPSLYLNDSTLAQPISTPLDTITYTVIGTDNIGCTNKDSVTLIVNRVVPTDAGTDQSVCPSTAITIGGNPTAPIGTSYQWSPLFAIDTSTSANPSVWPDSSMMYSVETTYGSLCKGIDSVQLNVYTLPKVEAGTNNQLCYGDSLQLSASGALSYYWSPSSSLSNSSIANPISFPDSTTTYLVTGTDTNGCSAIDSVQIEIFSLPNANAGNNQKICANDSCQLNASGGISYNWFPLSNLSSSLLSNPIAFPATSSFYYVSVTDSNGCTAVDSVYIHVNTLPIIDAGNDIATCANDSIILNATYDSTYRYEWFPTEGLSNSTIYNPSVYTETSTQYILTIIDTNNCQNSDSLQISISALPEAEFSFSLVPTCEGMFAEFSNQSTNAVNYNWNFGDGKTSTEKEPKHTFKQIGNETIMLIAYNSPTCADTSFISSDIKSFKEYLNIKIPDIFTPNNDGINDIFLQDLDPSLRDCIQLTVFNRWGEVIYSSKQGPTWDGNTSAGIAADDDTYLYILKIVDYEVRGTLKLMK